jgi:hypothetical protein
MAKKKISGLPAGSALNGTELVPIVQTGTTKRITTQDIANLGNASGVEGSGTINRLAKFTASSTIGNSQLFDDGTSVGLGTITPLGLLHLFKTAATTRLVMDSNAAQNRIISYRTNAVQRFGLYVNNTAESGANAGSDFAIRAYNDAGTLLSTPLFIKRSTGNVGIGTTTPANKLEVQVATAGTSVIGFFNNTDFTALNKSAIRVRQQTGASTGFSAYFGMDGNTLFLSNDTTATNHLAISTTGGAAFSAGVALSGATAPASGIQFPATQVASANNNNLDDYEEGTWTMGVSFGGGITGITYSGNTGNYVKIGKQVTITGYLLLTNKGSSTGIVSLTGLPFAVGAAAGNYSGASLVLSNITFLGVIGGYSNVGTSTASLTQTTTLGVTSALTDTNFANNSSVIISLTYFV